METFKVEASINQFHALLVATSKVHFVRADHRGCSKRTHHVGNAIRDRVGMFAIRTYHRAFNDVDLGVVCNAVSDHGTNREGEGMEHLEEDMM